MDASGGFIRTRALKVLALGLSLIGITALTGPRTAPPLYDSLCVADPYRALAPPAGATGIPPASSITKTVDFTDPTAAQVVTGESPPQVQVIIPANAVTGSATFTVRPVPPPPDLPANGSIDGNVYSITATARGGAMASIHQPMSIVLRSPSAAPSRIIDLYAGGRWMPLETLQVSCASQWLANTTAFGLYALVDPARTPATTQRGSAWTAGLAIVSVIVLAGVILLIRSRRSPGARPDPSR